MATATATKRKSKRKNKSGSKSKSKSPKPKKKVLRMIHGTGDNAITRYHCGVVETAKSENWQIMVTKRGKDGTIHEVPRGVRMVHRKDLTEAFHESHDRAGEGKFIDVSALSDDSKTVTDPRNVNPYLSHEGSYAVVVDVMMASTVKRHGKDVLGKLQGTFWRSAERGQNIKWKGTRSSENFVVASDWFTEDELWDAALKAQPSLKTQLQRQKSKRKNVKKHKSAREKFGDNIDVIRRATATVNAATGEKTLADTATPYAYPLEQCGFAIDMYFLTTGSEDGQEVGEYFYRLVVGRSEPWILYERDWAYEGADSKIAFRNEEARKAVRKAKKSA